MGNVTGLVPDEKLILPMILNKNLQDFGFDTMKYYGLSISHVRYPVFLQDLNLIVDYPLRTVWPFKMFSNGIG